MKKGIVFSFILALIAFTSVGMWGDIFSAGQAIKGFSWYLIPAIAFFGFMNDMIKFLRWELYLKRMGIRIPLKKSLVIFVSGLSMSATPGKVGMLIKSRMLKNTSGKSFLSSTPIIAAELYMDLLGLSVISLLAVGLFSKGIWIAIILCILPLLGLIQGITDRVIDLLAKIPVFSARAHELRTAIDDMFSLFGTRTLILAFCITLIAWTSEGVALVLILGGLGYYQGIIQATAIFGFSTLIGVLSMLPGGLIVTDAGLMGLIIHSGIPPTPAALATILARIFTLWLSVFIGSIVLVLNRAYIFGQIQEAKERG